MKTNPCTLGPRHKWSFRHNYIKVTQTRFTASTSKVGRYVCACGAFKSGPAQTGVSPDADTSLEQHLGALKTVLDRQCRMRKAA